MPPKLDIDVTVLWTKGGDPYPLAVEAVPTWDGELVERARLLQPGDCVDVARGDFVLRLRASAPEAKVARASLVSRGWLRGFGASAIGHALLLLTCVSFAPALDDGDDAMRDRLATMRRYIASSDEREASREARVEDTASAAPIATAAAKAVIAPSATTASAHGVAPRGEATESEPSASDATDFGMLQLLSTVVVDRPTDPWAPIVAGNDDRLGSIFAGDVGGDALGLGFGATPSGRDTKLAPSLDLGERACLDPAPEPRVDFGTVTSSPTVSHDAASAASTPEAHAPPSAPRGLAPDVVDRIIRASRGRVLACYADGLKRDPQLAGRVVVEIAIGRDGSVLLAQATKASDLADGAVRRCVVSVIATMAFPEPGEVVRVLYPFTFGGTGVTPSHGAAHGGSSAPRSAEPRCAGLRR